MKRRAFLTISATSLAGLAFGNRLSSFSESNLEKKYSIVLLGDTHFDTEPASAVSYTHLMGISPRTVEGHIRQALAFLREGLKGLFLLIFLLCNIN